MYQGWAPDLGGRGFPVRSLLASPSRPIEPPALDCWCLAETAWRRGRLGQPRQPWQWWKSALPSSLKNYCASKPSTRGGERARGPEGGWPGGHGTWGRPPNSASPELSSSFNGGPTWAAAVPPPREAERGGLRAQWTRPPETRMWRLLKEALAGDQPAGPARVRGFPESSAGLGRVCCGRVGARLAFG